MDILKYCLWVVAFALVLGTSGTVLAQQGDAGGSGAPEAPAESSSSPDPLIDAIGLRMTGEGSDVKASGSDADGLPSFGGLVARLTVALIVTLAALYGALLGLRRFSGRRGVGGLGAPGQVRVISRTALSAKSAIHLVEVGGQVLVVGEAPGGLTLLTTVSEEESVAQRAAGRSDETLMAPARGRAAGALSEFAAQLGLSRDRMSAGTLSEKLRQGGLHARSMSRKVAQIGHRRDSGSAGRGFD